MSIVLSADGDPWSISWRIDSGARHLEESRAQAEMYRGQVSIMQARFMALHVGLFWGIGVFAIRNDDQIRMVLNDPLMLSYMESGSSGDDFIDRRIHHINILIRQRRLDVSFVVQPER